jgi:hypothetical protein
MSIGDLPLSWQLALPGKVTRRAYYKVFGIYDRFLTNVQWRPLIWKHQDFSIVNCLSL